MTATGVSILAVDTDILHKTAETLHGVGEANGSLALPLGSLALRVGTLLSWEVSGTGTRAAASLGAAALSAGARSAAAFSLSRQLETVASSYEQAEAIATRLLEESKVVLPELVYGVSAYFSPAGGGGRGLDAGVGIPGLASSLVAKTLFGFGFYLDTKLNGDEFAKKRANARLDALGLPDSLREALGVFLFHKTKNIGLHRGLAQESVSVEKLTEKRVSADLDRRRAELEGKLVQDPRGPADLAHNLNIFSQLGDLIDEEHAGEVMEYDGLFMQVVRDSSGDIISVRAYLPGTDPDNLSSLGGSLASWAANLAAININPGDTAGQTSAYMQLLDRALADMGLEGSAVPIHLAGFSQGGLVVAGASNNREFRSKYNIAGAYIQGSPVGDDPLPDDIPVTVVRDRDDKVTRLQGSGREKYWGKNVAVIETSFRQTAEGAARYRDGKEGPMGTHGAYEYQQVLAENKAAEGEQAHLVSYERGDTVETYSAEGSTWAPETSQGEISFYSASSAALGAYSLFEEVGDFLPHPLAQSLPDLPHDFDYAEFYERVRGRGIGQDAADVVEEADFQYSPPQLAAVG